MSAKDFEMEVRFYRLSEAIAPYFTALYSFTFNCPDSLAVEDYLHPEWATMRFTAEGTPPSARVIPSDMALCPDFVVSGPTSRAIQFSITTSHLIGLGLQPAGWARFVGRPASALSNKIIDGRDPAFSQFAPLLDCVNRADGDHDKVAAGMDAYLLQLHASTPPVPDRVLICQDALKNPDLRDVDELANLVGVSRRTLERLCGQYFGFPPKTLLRRQRFLRSLGRFMLDTRGSWSKSLDSQYFDQAHFVRDFRGFMGMTPSEYAEMPHPILDRIMGQRMIDQGAAPRTDLPTVLRYAGEPA